MCTIEKANVTINRLIAEGRLGAQPIKSRVHVEHCLLLDCRGPVLDECKAHQLTLRDVLCAEELCCVVIGALA